uniref:Uncharacterized protein n=1 Tax=Fagus sylvatica TaxID=28930 RepID=A0A2N9I0Y7_FAGSY
MSVYNSKPQGRWIWDCGAYHVGHANTYSFVDGNNKYSLKCPKDMLEGQREA